MFTLKNLARKGLIFSVITVLADGLVPLGHLQAQWWLSMDPVYAGYHKVSNISRTNSPNLNVSRLILQVSLPNPL